MCTVLNLHNIKFGQALNLWTQKKFKTVAWKKITKLIRSGDSIYTYFQNHFMRESLEYRLDYKCC